MRKIIGLILIVAVAGILVGCETTTPEIKSTFPQPEGLSIRGVVYGTKLDQSYSEHGDLLAGAMVTLVGDSQTWTTSTDANGEFSFTGLPQCSYSEGYKITVTKDGYQRRIDTGVYLDSDNILPDNSVSVVDIVLDNDPVVLDMSPLPGAVIDAATETIMVEFNEAMDQSSVRPTLTSQGIRTYAIADTQTLTTTWSADSKILYITTGNLLPNQIYRLQVDPDDVAKDQAGYLLDTGGGISSNAGGLPEEVYNTTSSEYYYRTASGGVPGAPSNLCITLNDLLPADADYADVDGGGDDVKGYWDTPTSGEISGYRAYVSLSSTGPWSLISQVTSGSNYFTDDIDGVHLAIFGTEDVDPVCYNKWAFVNNKIYFKVVAFNGEGESTTGATAEAKEGTGPQLDTTAYSGRTGGGGKAAELLNNNYYLPALVDGTDTKIAYIAFNEPVDESTILAAYFQHTDNVDVTKGAVTNATVMTSSSDNLSGVWTGDVFTIVKITSDTDFALNDKIKVSTDVKDLAGNPVESGTGDEVSIP